MAARMKKMEKETFGSLAPNLENAQSEINERKKKANSPMPENQGLCLRCNKRVWMVDPKVVYSGGNREILQSVCPICGTKVNRVRGIR